MSVPDIRLYLLAGRRTWYASTRAPDGKRWQFSTGQRDEEAARAAAEERVSRAYGVGPAKAAAPEVAAPASGAAAEPPTNENLRDRIRRAGGAAGGGDDAGGSSGPSSSASSEASDEKPEASAEVKMVADVLALAAVVGWTSAIDRKIRARKWKDGNETGTFKPGPANSGCVELMQSGLREKLEELLGQWQLTPLLRAAAGATGIAVTMIWQSERVPDAPRGYSAPPPPARGPAPRPPAAPAPPPPSSDVVDEDHLAQLPAATGNLMRLRPER